jgi:hypothetical protein
MRRLFVLNSIFMAVLMTASIARAAECTIERDVLGTALRQASSCVRAYRVFEACSFGASGDVPLGTIVQKKCESVFLARLDAAKKANYKSKPGDEVPHMLTRKPHPRLEEFAITCTKRLLQQNRHEREVLTRAANVG